MIEAADQHFMQRHGGQQVARQVQSQGIEFQLGHVDALVAGEVEAAQEVAQFLLARGRLRHCIDPKATYSFVEKTFPLKQTRAVT